ncbi:MAG: hypothetical protein NXI24_10285 [bacterium]|nr:hypothetical protein [bacterium]
MKRILTTLLLIGTIAAGGTACASSQGSYAIASDKEIDFSQNYEKTQDSVTGVSIGRIIILFPAGDLRDSVRLKEAIVNAMENSQADLLKNVKVTSSYFYIPFIYGESKYEVEGEAWTQVK